MADAWYSLCPHKNVFTLTEPKAISGNLPIPKPVNAIISNWISSPDDDITEDKIQRFNSIPCEEVNL